MKSYYEYSLVGLVSAKKPKPVRRCTFQRVDEVCYSVTGSWAGGIDHYCVNFPGEDG